MPPIWVSGSADPSVRRVGHVYVNVLVAAPAGITPRTMAATAKRSLRMLILYACGSPTSPQKLFCEMVARLTTRGEMFMVTRNPVLPLAAVLPVVAVVDEKVPRTSPIELVTAIVDPAVV